MILYANGDSHTQGFGLEDTNQSFASLVAKHFELPIVNHALAGGSNQRTIRISQDWIRTSQQRYFVLIGWTSWEREEWPWRGDFFQVNSSADTQGDPELEQRYRAWVTGLDEATVPRLGKEWHENIWQFHNKLKQREIPHLFFNCFYDFFADQSLHRDWDHCFVEPYDNTGSYWHYLRDHGFKTYGQDQYHYAADAHQAWANVLINWIEKYQLL